VLTKLKLKTFPRSVSLTSNLENLQAVLEFPVGMLTSIP